MQPSAPESTIPATEKIQGIFFLVSTVVLWGIQPLAMKLVLQVYSIPLTAFIRSVAASLLFGYLLSRQKQATSISNPSDSSDREARLRIWLWLIVGGIGLGVSNLFWNASLVYTTIGATATLQLISSVLIAFYGIAFLSERCTLIRATGLILSLLGMFLISWNGQDLNTLLNSHYFKGNMFALASGIGWAICGIAQKVAVKNRSGVSVVTPMFIITAIILFLPAIITPKLIAPFSLSLLLLMLLTGVLGLGVGNLLFTLAMRAIPASIGAAVLTIIPMIGMAAGVIFLKEPTTTYLLVGGPLTSLGVAAAFLSMYIRKD